jgi:hypothetical protein
MVQRHGLNAPAGSRRTRRLGWLGLVLAVMAAHGWVTAELAARMDELATVAQMPARIEVAYVRELMPAAPPVLAPRAAPTATAPRASRRKVPVVAPAASAASAAVADAAASAPDAAVSGPSPDVAPPTVTAQASMPAASSPPTVSQDRPAEPPAPEGPEVQASAPQRAASGAGGVFEWPASTRLTYKLTGNVRGEVNGDAQVEWVRSGSRYQVHLDVTVGLPVAPLITRRMSSDGELTDQGLVPQRYDEDTKVMFRDRRRVTLLFEPDAVRLPDGQRRERWPGVQDTASQFVQLSWLFTTQPQLLRTGGAVEMPLALPRSVDRWVYDVLEEDTLYTPFGELQAFHLKPRRSSRPGGDLSAEIWFAPQLRYLPVRIRIQQDADTFIDLMLTRRPELAGP